MVSPGAFSFTQPELENYLATNSVTATTPDAAEVAQREKEVPMWTLMSIGTFTIFFSILIS